MSKRTDALAASGSFAAVSGPRSARSEAFEKAMGPAAPPPPPNELPVNLISQNPDNPRDHLSDLEGITQTIKELGVINAITVARVSAYLGSRPERADDLDTDTQYIVIDGHRRLEGARRAGLETIKVFLDDALVATDEKLLETAFVANLQRADMTDLEKANALKALVAFYGSQSKAALRLGISQGSISNYLSLLEITPDLQADLAAGKLTKEHVRNLRKVAPEEQRAVAEERKAKSEKASSAVRQRVQRPQAPASAEEPSGDYHGVIIPKTETAHPAGPMAPPAGPARQAPPGDPADTVPVPVPAGEQFPEADSPAGQPAGPRQIKMPWDDGVAVAELAIRKMTRGQRRRLLARLEAEERTAAAADSSRISASV